MKALTAEGYTEEWPNASNETTRERPHEEITNS